MDFRNLTIDKIPSEDQLSGMDWETLINMRRQNPKNERLQDIIAPYEHRAYAREDVAENPLRALSYGYLIPGYQAAKVVGVVRGTKPSFDQMMQGFYGVGEGLKRYGAETLKNLFD